jgi:hypothetical protein
MAYWQTPQKSVENIRRSTAALKPMGSPALSHAL